MSNEIKTRGTVPPIVELPGFCVAAMGNSLNIMDPDNEAVAFIGPDKHAKYPELHRAIQQHIQDWRGKQE